MISLTRMSRDCAAAVSIADASAAAAIGIRQRAGLMPESQQEALLRAHFSVAR
jgi:hypothetical protein